MRKRGGRYTPPKPKALVPQGDPWDFVFFTDLDLAPGDDVIEAMRAACPVCSSEGIHHQADDDQQAPKRGEAPAANQGPSDHTPGTSRSEADGHQGTH